jgi:hypothetical protein
MRKLGAMLAAVVLVAAGIWAAVVSTASTASPAVTPVSRTAVQSGQITEQVRAVHPAVKAGVTARHAPAAVGQVKGEDPGENGENESDGNETDTHVDAPGQNVDHQCPPDCDTANGEQP